MLFNKLLLLFISEAHPYYTTLQMVHGRAVISLIISALIVLILMPGFIAFMKRSQMNDNTIREDTPINHLKKQGTPTMGGIVLILAATLSTILCADLCDKNILICLVSLIGFAIIGAVDDYCKIHPKYKKGITARQKFLAQLLCVSFIIYYMNQGEMKNMLHVSFFSYHNFWYLGWIYVLFIQFVVIGTSNAINLTDGLDGLLAGCMVITLSALACILYKMQDVTFPMDYQIEYFQNMNEIFVIIAAVIGSMLAFLVFNFYPAKIFMGDTGSVALGGFLGTVSFVTKTELILAVIGGVFVIETLSVIMQVLFFKITKGRRIFLMTPIHHHFEKKNYHEITIILGFWCAAIIFGYIGVLIVI